MSMIYEEAKHKLTFGKATMFGKGAIPEWIEIPKTLGALWGVKIDIAVKGAGRMFAITYSILQDKHDSSLFEVFDENQNNLYFIENEMAQGEMWCSSADDVIVLREALTGKDFEIDEVPLGVQHAVELIRLDIAQLTAKNNGRIEKLQSEKDIKALESKTAFFGIDRTVLSEVIAPSLNNIFFKEKSNYIKNTNKLIITESSPTTTFVKAYMEKNKLEKDEYEVHILSTERIMIILKGHSKECHKTVIVSKSLLNNHPDSFRGASYDSIEFVKI